MDTYYDILMEKPLNSAEICSHARVACIGACPRDTLLLTPRIAATKLRVAVSLSTCNKVSAATREKWQLTLY